MALVVKDRVKETTATTGQGTLTLAGAVSGFQSFTSALSDGDTTYYAIFETSTNEWEVGLGTFTASGTTLARTTILESSNAGSAINLTAGAADVFITQPAEKAVYLDASDNVTFAGDLTVDTNTLYVDSTNNRVGIGTTSPATQASVQNASTSLGLEIDTTSGFASGPTLRGYYRTGSAYKPIAMSGSTVHFGINDVEKMRIDSGGNVGINTSSAVPLDANAQLLAIHGDAVGAERAQIKLTTTTSGQAAGDGFYIAVDDSAAYISQRENQPLIISTNATERMRIDSSGQVGIGTSSPSSALDVDQSQNAETNIELTNTNTGSSAQVRTKYTTDGGLFTVGKTSDAHAFGGDAYIYNVDNTNIRFATNDTERMRINSSGNVLVGTTDDSVYNNSGSGTGINLQNFGNIAVARDGNDCMVLNRLNSDGAIALFNKDGTTVGSIGSVSGSTAYIDGGSGFSGIQFGGDGLVPRDNGGLADATSDLGTSSYRFRDLYLSGSAYANALVHDGDTDTYVGFETNQVNLRAGNVEMSYNANGLFLNDGSVREDYDALSGTSPTCNVNSGGAFSLSMSGNTTFSFTSPASGYSTGFVLQLTGNGSTVTWPSSVDWAGGTAPDAPASGETDILVFWTRDGGTTWYGFQAGDAMA